MVMSNKDTKEYGPRVWVLEDDGLGGRTFLVFRTSNEATAYAATRYPACCPITPMVPLATLEARVKELRDYNQKAEDKICTLEDQIEEERKKLADMQADRNKWMRKFDDSNEKVFFWSNAACREEKEKIALRSQLAKAREALDLIAAPKRNDGTYNRSREACEVLARETLAALMEQRDQAKGED